MEVSGWRNDGKVVRSWTALITSWKISKIFPSQKQAKTAPTSIRDLKTVIDIKKEEAKQLVHKSYRDSGAFPEWTNEPDRQRYIVLKREIKNLEARISQCV